MPLEAVHNAALDHGLIYPVDFAARGSCTIGGNIATNAGGIRVIRYGNTREWVAGLKVVTVDGEVELRKTAKIRAGQVVRLGDAEIRVIGVEG